MLLVWRMSEPVSVTLDSTTIPLVPILLVVVPATKRSLPFNMVLMVPTVNVKLFSIYYLHCDGIAPR